MPATAFTAIKLLVLPPGSLIILALVGLMFHKRRFGLILSAMALLSLLLLSLPIVVALLAGYWERYPPVSFSQIENFSPQALVVIGGGATDRADEYQMLLTVHTRTLARLRYAAKLTKQFELPILVSGGRLPNYQNVSEAQLMAQVLEEEFNIRVTWKEQESANTAENARFTRELLVKQGVNDIILVTQAYHMPRALHEFTKAGFKVLPAPTAFIADQSEKPFDFTIVDFLPSPVALMDGFLLAHESLGMLWYAVRY